MRQWFLADGKHMKWTLHSLLHTACWVSRLQHGGEEPRQSTLKLAKLRTLRTGSLGKGRQLEFAMRKLHKDGSAKVCSLVPLNTGELLGLMSLGSDSTYQQLIKARGTTKLEKHLRELTGVIPWFTNPSARVENLIIHGASNFTENSEWLCLNSGEYEPQPTDYRVLPSQV